MGSLNLSAGPLTRWIVHSATGGWSGSDCVSTREEPQLAARWQV